MMMMIINLIKEIIISISNRLQTTLESPARLPDGFLV